MDIVIYTQRDLDNDYRNLPLDKIHLQHLTGDVYTAAIWARKRFGRYIREDK